MCGLRFMFLGGDQICTPDLKECLAKRGPDERKTAVSAGWFADFYRLAMFGNKPESMQPFTHRKIILMCNGEIYNHEELELEYNLRTGVSDCECIIYLYSKFGINSVVQLIQGEYAFVIYDMEKQLVHFARSLAGQRPLFYKTLDSKLEVASLYQAMELPLSEQVQPGTIYTFDTQRSIISVQMFKRFIYKPIPNFHVGYVDIFTALKKAVKIRVEQCDRPVGFLLSGGFDSSMVLSIALTYEMLKYPPHVFTIGFDEKAPDVISARKVVDFLHKKLGKNSFTWHKIILPIQSGIDAIENTIKELESYDTTTIRASVPMYLLAKYISQYTDVKAIISGEGADELFGGYMYFKYAPNNTAFVTEITHLLHKLYLYDCLRADRVTACHGLELRAPFLDDNLVDLVLQCAELKSSKYTTKHLLRLATEGYDLLPPDIHVGKKEAFSDGVGNCWINAIKEHANSNLMGNYMGNYSPHIYPTTAEGKYMQTIFNKLYPNAWHLTVAYWLPNPEWINTGQEPSATVLDKY